MKAKTLKILIFIFSLLTALFSWSFYSRSRMNYNSEGKYFDKETLIVYDEQALMVYGLITFILLSLTLLSTLKLKSIKNKSMRILILTLIVLTFISCKKENEKLQRTQVEEKVNDTIEISKTNRTCIRKFFNFIIARFSISELKIIKCIFFCFFNLFYINEINWDISSDFHFF